MCNLVSSFQTAKQPIQVGNLDCKRLTMSTTVTTIACPFVVHYGDVSPILIQFTLNFTRVFVILCWQLYGNNLWHDRRFIRDFAAVFFRLGNFVQELRL